MLTLKNFSVLYASEILTEEGYKQYEVTHQRNKGQEITDFWAWTKISDKHEIRPEVKNGFLSFLDKGVLILNR